MKGLKKFLIAVIVLIVVLLGVSFLLPSDIHVERKITINAPVENVFDQINDVKKWEAWSPWHAIDPEMKLIYSENTIGVNAWYEWTSEHPNVGSGKLTITDSQKGKVIQNQMDFVGQGIATGGFYFKEADEGIELTWYMDSDMGRNPIGKYMGLFMDKWVGQDFEKGLASIKSIAESLPPPPPPVNVLYGDQEEIMFVGITEKCAMSDLEQKFGEMYGELMQFIQKKKLNMPLPPLSRAFSEPTDSMDVQACIPVDREVKGEGRIVFDKIPAGKIAYVMHMGSYDNLYNTYNALEKWIQENKKTVMGPPFEIYLTDPQSEPDASKWQTKVCFPVD